VFVVLGSGGEELDPVYSFLKLTAVMPREGTTVMPGDGHHCCGKTDQDIGTGLSQSNIISGTVTAG